MASSSSRPGPLPRIPREEEVIPLMTEIIAKYHAVRNQIVASINISTATFDTVIRPLIDLHNLTLGDIETIYTLEDIAPSIKSKEASIEARRLFLEAEAEWLARRDLFDLIKAVHDRNEDLDQESKLWLDQELLEFTLSGHGRLDDSQITEYKHGKARLEEQIRQYFQNLSSDQSGVWFSDEDLDGVPADQVSRWALGTDAPHQGQRFVPFANRGMFHVTSFAKSAETRKRMFIANERRLPENVKLVKEIAISRDSQARLLGYPSHAAFTMQRMIAKEPVWVEGFLRQLSDGLKDVAEKRLEDLENLRIRDPETRGAYGEPDSHAFPPWDVAYYTRLLGQKIKIDHRSISEYFPLETTTEAMLGIFASYLQLHFTRVDTADSNQSSIWHDDVQVYSAWDESSTTTEFLGYLYLDLLWRENKHQGFRNRSMQSVSMTE